MIAIELVEGLLKSVDIDEACGEDPRKHRPPNVREKLLFHLSPVFYKLHSEIIHNGYKDIVGIFAGTA